MRNSGLLNRLILQYILLLALSLFGEVSVKHVSKNKETDIPSFDNEQSVWVSIPHFAKELGYNWRWSFFSKKLTLSKNSDSFFFFEDNSFYRFGDEIIQLPVSPERKGGKIFLPIDVLITAFQSNGFPGKIDWSQNSREVVIQTLSHSVTAITYNDRGDHTDVVIALSDSVSLDFSYIHPRLTVNISNVTVDPGELNLRKAAGIVDSVQVYQHENSAEIVLFLNKKVDHPQLQYGSNNQLNFALRDLSESQKRPPIPEMEIPELRRIVIDPGHGGKDPGAIGPSGLYEKDVMLKIALVLRKELEKQGFEVLMTREKDVFIPLRDRTKFANDNKADLFISLHANAIDGTKARKDTIRGYKSYFLSQAKNEHDKLAAMRENAVIELEEKPQHYDFLQNVLIDLAGNEFLRQSQEFCIIIDQTFSGGSIAKRIPKLHLGVGQANFWVLNGAYMPSILFEVGFISNPKEEKLLNKSDVQSDIAKGLSEAIVKFKHQLEIGI